MKDQLIPDEQISNKIYLIRGQKVMLDIDLAQLYGVETKRLKEQVKRNITRFPSHYMFQLTREENEFIRSQNATYRHGEHSKYLSMVFSEHGILMLSNVLKSESAIKVSIRIIDIFVKLRETLVDHTEIWLQVEKIKNRLDNQDKNMEVVFQYLDELSNKLDKPKPESEPRKRIGYKSEEW